MLDPSQWGLESALRAGLLVALTAWAAWWALSLLVALFDVRMAARLGPPLLRAVLVGSVLAAAATPAHAERGAPTGALDGLPLPERPLTGAAPAASPPPTVPQAPTHPDHVVRAGDSLWTIVRDRSPDVSDASIAARVSRWHDANLDVIGPDPDLIRPGQRLTPPGAS